MAQSRILSALRLGHGGLRTLQPIQRRPLPPPEPSTAKEESGEKAVVPKSRRAQPPSITRDRDTLSAEESREEALMHPRRRTEYVDPILEVARSGRPAGRGRLIPLGDSHRTWGRGWGSAMTGRRAVGARGTLDWVGRMTREEDDSRRDGGRRRLLRSDMTHRMSGRGRRTTSAESRLDPRRSSLRTFHDYDRLGGFAEYRDEDSGALLVEFNDGTDEPGREVTGVEAGSAGSAESGDTSQDGDEMVRLLYRWYLFKYIRDSNQVIDHRECRQAPRTKRRARASLSRGATHYCIVGSRSDRIHYCLHTACTVLACAKGYN